MIFYKSTLAKHWLGQELRIHMNQPGISILIEDLVNATKLALELMPYEI